MSNLFKMFYTSERGVTFIITFLVMTVIVAVVLGISTILVNEIKVISNIGNYVSVFYAADTGVEKTLYFNRKHSPSDDATRADNTQDTAGPDIGALGPGGFNNWFYKGNLDELRVYSRLLSGPEITQLSQGHTGPTDYISYWKFDETTAGSTVVDSSGFGNNGTPFGFNGNADLPQPDISIPPTQFSNLRSLYFGGAAAVKEETATNLLPLSTMTACAWVKPKVADGNDLWSSWYSILQTYGVHAGWDMGLRPVGDAFELATEFGVSPPNPPGQPTNEKFKTSAQTIPADQWSYVCIQQDGDAFSGLKLFINGPEVTTYDGAYTTGQVSGFCNICTACTANTNDCTGCALTGSDCFVSTCTSCHLNYNSVFPSDPSKVYAIDATVTPNLQDPTKSDFKIDVNGFYKGIIKRQIELNYTWP